MTSIVLVNPNTVSNRYLKHALFKASQHNLSNIL